MMGYGNYWGNSASAMFGNQFLGGMMGFLLLPLMFWSLAWKGWALWKAAKADSPVWFIILLLVNTVGILDILYIFVFSKSRQKLVKSVSKRSKK